MYVPGTIIQWVYGPYENKNGLVGISQQRKTPYAFVNILFMANLTRE